MNIYRRVILEHPQTVEHDFHVELLRQSHAVAVYLWNVHHDLVLGGYLADEMLENLSSYLVCVRVEGAQFVARAG